MFREILLSQSHSTASLLQFGADKSLRSGTSNIGHFHIAYSQLVSKRKNIRFDWMTLLSYCIYEGR